MVYFCIGVDYSTVITNTKNSIAQVLTTTSTGSGFVFLKSNIVVTCNHVVSDVAVVQLHFPDEPESQYRSGKVVLKDEEHDLALIKFDGPERTPLKLGEREAVKEGSPVIFSGYPLNSDSVTSHQGIISAIFKDPLGVTSYSIDGSVNSGNSGCPLMNREGEVIGVVNAKRRVRNDLLAKVESMKLGALSLHGNDIVEIFTAIIQNVQVGIGYAIPASYIPEHKEDSENEQR